MANTGGVLELNAIPKVMLKWLRFFRQSVIFCLIGLALLVWYSLLL
uniref:Uncharacterized protein n=1 Tax=Anguilla anguilla TaxID=7936 RepID=A0A0E9P6B1_ANGAN